MTNQRKLLAEYAVNGSEEAFRELVTCYLSLVYATAMRLVNGDTHRAEDIVQTVFADLARRAGTLSAGVMLGGWLHQRTCHVAASTMRSERRRQNRERQAAEMNIPPDSTETSFERIAPVLDEAINQLGAEDRAAITLRFFEGRDFLSVGEAMGSNADAARKRVARALEKLRGLLLRRGVAASGATLAAVLGAHTVTAVPASLAASVASAALASAAASGGLTLLLINLMSLTKLHFIMGTVIVAGLGTTLVIEHQRLTELREQNQNLTHLRDQAKRVAKPRLPAPRMRTAAPATEEPADNARSTNLLTRILNNGEAFKLSLQQVEDYLQDNRRSAESLLAAFRATDDPALLREALEKYPHDPRVNFAAYFASLNELSPEDRRLRLEAFKQSAPDNALASYLSAQDYFKSGQTDQAVQELIAASGKAKFQDYSREFIQNAEDAYRAARYSDADAKAVAAFGLPLPQLAELRHLGQNLGDLANLYRQAGDEASAQAALQMGVNLGRQVGEPSGQNYLISDLVGLAIERQILERMDPASFYDNAGQTVKDRLEELAQRRETYKEIQGPVDSSGRWGSATEVMESLSEQDRISFFDRIKVFGELEALRWARNKVGKP